MITTNFPTPDTRDGAWTDAQIEAAARALCKQDSAVCGTDFDDTWKFYGHEFRDQALVALNAALGDKP